MGLNLFNETLFPFYTRSKYHQIHAYSHEKFKGQSTLLMTSRNCNFCLQKKIQQDNLQYRYFWEQKFFGMDSYTFQNFQGDMSNIVYIVLSSLTPRLTFCLNKIKNSKMKFLGRGVLRDEFLKVWELSGWHSTHFLPVILWYGSKLHSSLLSSRTWKITFFWTGSSSTCKNFQSFILHRFQFDHMVLKRLSTSLNWENHFLCDRIFCTR